MASSAAALDKVPLESGYLRLSTKQCSRGSLASYQGLRTSVWQHRASHSKCVCKSTHLSAVKAQAQATAVKPAKEVISKLEIDWDNLGFGYHETDYMFVSKCGLDGEWEKGELQPFGHLQLSPSAGILNYGQGVFEGLKAYRTDDDRILLFRPEENAMRMLAGADRLCMPAPPVGLFVQAVKQTVLANKRWIPPPGKGSLYIRPLLMGSGAVLGLAPAPEYTFIVFVAPVGNYFKEGLSPIHLKVESTYHRAAPGGTGGIKTIGNYASVLKTQIHAKKEGFSDVLYLDAVENKYIEEVSSCNIFIVKVLFLTMFVFKTFYTLSTFCVWINSMSNVIQFVFFFGSSDENGGEGRRLSFDVLKKPFKPSPCSYPCLTNPKEMVKTHSLFQLVGVKTMLKCESRG